MFINKTHVEHMLNIFQQRKRKEKKVNKKNTLMKIYNLFCVCKFNLYIAPYLKT